MISYIQGKITEKYENTITLECCGIGYEIFVSTNTLNALSFDDENDVDKRQFVDSGVKNPEEAYIDSESEIELKNKIFESLSSLESNVLKLYLDGYSYNEISVKIDKNVKTIDNAIQRIRKKLNTALNEEN